LERDARDANQLMTQERVQLLLAVFALRERAGEFNVALNGTRMTERRIVADAERLASGLLFQNNGSGEIWRTLQVSGPPRTAPPAMSSGYQLDKRFYQMSGASVDMNSIRQGDRIIVVVSGKPDGARTYPSVIVDLLPAGLEIESVLGPADGMGRERWDGSRRNGPFSWVGEIDAGNVSEARDDRFVAAMDVRGSEFTFAYIARAVTPGRFTMPAAQVEDMYRPGVMARTSTGSIRIAPRDQ
jgi:uncharacterized protein YfaS (alpha-2-macroglobulin family)